MTSTIDLYALVFLLACISGSANVHKKLHYFETLRASEIVFKERGEGEGSQTDIKEVSFKAFRRSFDLVLFPGSPVLAPDFKAQTVDRYGNTAAVAVRPYDFLTGHLAEDSSVSASAHYEDGILCATISFPTETYVVEPAWRHLPASPNYSVIIYRGSDILWNGYDKGSKRTMMLPDPIKFHEIVPLAKSHRRQDNNTKEMNRNKRAITGRKICPMLIVVDFDFYKEIGRSRQNTIQYITGILQYANTLITKTDWDPPNKMSGYGIQVKRIIIHTEYTEAPTGRHYNKGGIVWTAMEKLEAFYRNATDKLKDFCLGHLFTSFSFKEGTLGLSVVPSSGDRVPGGICTIPARLKPEDYRNPVYTNAGFTTAKGLFRRLLPILQLQLVTTHEIGHAWGANHDPDTAECAPKSEAGGKYIMWYAFNTGFEEKNVRFSPCSKRDVALVLRTKADRCFVENSSNATRIGPSPVTVIAGTPGEGARSRYRPAFCGNTLVDLDEECDAGLLADDTDPCCAWNCTLKKGAQCSDINFSCCLNCRAAPKGTTCASGRSIQCRKAAVCNGVSLDCPEADPEEDNTTCFEKGKCRSGRCLSYCEALGISRGESLHPCMCDQNITASCRYCCIHTEIHGGRITRSCEPTEEILSDGRPCLLGYCQAGECQTLETKLSVRLYEPSSAFNNVMDMVGSRLVPLIVVVCMTVWIPVAILVTRHDNRCKNRRCMILNRLALCQRPCRGQSVGRSSSSTPCLYSSSSGGSIYSDRLTRRDYLLYGRQSSYGRGLHEIPPGIRTY